MPFLEGATNLGRRAMPCWKVDERPKCKHGVKTFIEGRYCNHLKRPIGRRPFNCIHYKPEKEQ